MEAAPEAGGVQVLTFHEVRDNVKKRLADKKANVSPTVTKQLNLLYLYCNLVIRDGRRIATSEGLARAETPDNEGDGKYLARKVSVYFSKCDFFLCCCLTLIPPDQITIYLLSSLGRFAKGR